MSTCFLLVLLCGWSIWPDSFFRAYWFGLMFWTQLSLGSLIILLIQFLTGGEWGKVGAPFLQAAASGFFLLLPLYIPVFFSLPHLFSWTKIEPGLSTPALVNKQIWLNSPAFILRSFLYLGAFYFLIRARHRPVLETMAGPALVLTLLLISFCSSDWMMSLQPTFYSSLYPFLYFSGTLAATFPLLTGTIAWSQSAGLMESNPDLLLAYGKLLFAAVLFWGYIVFSQFIIIWTGNLPDEAEWYVVRAEPAWLWLTLLVVAGHFAIPFCLLLSQKMKKNARQLLLISVWLFVLHFFEVFWMMRPTPGEGFLISPFDFLLPPLMGAMWFGFVLGSKELADWNQLAKRKAPHDQA